MMRITPNNEYTSMSSTPSSSLVNAANAPRTANDEESHPDRRTFAKLRREKQHGTTDGFDGIMSTTALLPHVHFEFAPHINQLRQVNHLLSGATTLYEHSVPSLEHLFSNSLLCVHSLTQFYKVQSKISDLYNTMMREYPTLPKNYYRQLNVILKMIDVHYLNVHSHLAREKPVSTVTKSRNQVAHDPTHGMPPRSPTNDPYFFLKKDLYTLEKKVFRIVKSLLIAKWQTVIVENAMAAMTASKPSSTANQYDKLLVEIMNEIHQWNRLLKTTWDTFTDIHENQTFFANLLSHQISLRELCVRACDARFCCIYARGKLPKRVRISTSGGYPGSLRDMSSKAAAHRASAPHLGYHRSRSSIASQISNADIPGRRYSALTMHGGNLKRNSPEKSETVRFTDRLDFSSLTIDPFYDSDNYSVSSSGSPSFETGHRYPSSHHSNDSVRYQLDNRFLTSDEVRHHIDAMIGDEYECVKKLTSTIEGMDECYLPLFETDLNGFLNYRYFRHKIYGGGMRNFSHTGSASVGSPSKDVAFSASPTSMRLLNDGTVIDHTDVNRLINEQRQQQYLSGSHNSLGNVSTSILDNDSLLDQDQEEQLFIPVCGSTISHIKDYYVQYFSIQMHRFVNFADAPSVMGVNALVSGASSGASLDTFGSSGLSLRTNLEQFSALHVGSSQAVLDQARTQLQREFMKLLPNMNRFAAKEDFNFHRRYAEVQKTELLQCQTHLFSHIYTFLRDISTRYDLAPGQNAGGHAEEHHTLDDSSSSFAEQQRMLQDLINEYLVKIVRFMSNFAHKHISGYLKIPRLQSMCILHSELTHFSQIMSEVFHTDGSKYKKMHQKTDSTYISLSAASPKSEIVSSLHKLDQLRDQLRDKLTSEICDISAKFWLEKYSDDQKKKSKSKGLGIICCSGTMHLTSPVETNQGQVQRAIDTILQPAFESIACSHPESRSALVEEFVTSLLSTYLDYIKRLGLKHQRRKKNLLWSVMRRFRSDMIFFHNWIMQTPLLSKMEKQLVIRFGIFDKIDAILFELDASTQSTKNRSAKYSIATNPSDNISLQLKKSSIMPEDTQRDGPEKFIMHSNSNGKIQHRRSSSWFHTTVSPGGENLSVNSLANHHQRSLSDESNRSAVRDLSEWQSIFAAL